MHVAVFDTNILFSAAGWRGNPYRCVELARAGAVRGVTCKEILEEFEEKLKDKLEFSEDAIAESSADLLGFLELVTISGTLRCISHDPDDDKVIECAVASKATHIVTGDRRHPFANEGV